MENDVFESSKLSNNTHIYMIKGYFNNNNVNNVL